MKNLLTTKTGKLAVAGVVLCALGPLLALTGLVTGFPAFVVSVAGLLLCLIAFIASCVGVARRPRAPFVWPALVSVGPVIAGAIIFASMSGHPRINDITTDASAPVALANGEFPAANGPLIASHYPEVKPLLVAAELPAVRAALAGIIANDATLTLTHTSDDGFVAVATSGVFRFKDDVAVRLDAVGEGNQTLVNVRSRSRSGQADFGVNAARIRSLLDRLQSAVGGAG